MEEQELGKEGTILIRSRNGVILDGHIDVLDSDSGRRLIFSAKDIFEFWDKVHEGIEPNCTFTE